MTKSQKILLSLCVLVAFIGLVVGLISYFFGVEEIISGEAYGFKIGDSRSVTYLKATKLYQENEITDINTWPVEEFYRPFEDNEMPEKNNDPKWVMTVNPEWWNNSITITFDDHAVIEIRRDRIIWELP